MAVCRRGETADGNQSIDLLDATRSTPTAVRTRSTCGSSRFSASGECARISDVDLYNICNVHTPTWYDRTCDDAPATGLGPGGEWLRPTAIVRPRFARLNLTVRLSRGYAR